ncbi:MAG: HK97 gp10 family phage protein [Hydrogenophaga sp.]|nr:HK97 gp10 family phage protein [Hydrogenophaga sp.]
MEGTFSLDVSKFVQKAGRDTDIVIRKVGGDVLRSIVEKSPVDTGRFRANWVVSYGPTTQTVLGLDRSGIETINRGLQLIQVFNPEDGELWISNNLPYARRLEYGYSGQAPAGMVRITVLEFQRFVDAAARSL